MNDALLLVVCQLGAVTMLVLPGLACSVSRFNGTPATLKRESFRFPTAKKIYLLCFWKAAKS